MRDLLNTLLIVNCRGIALQCRFTIVNVTQKFPPKIKSSIGTPPTTTTNCKLQQLRIEVGKILLDPRDIGGCASLRSYIDTKKAVMIEIILDDRLGKKVRVKCNEDDTIGDVKKLAAAQLGTRPEKLKIQKWYTVYKDHITLQDYEIHNGMSLEL